MWIYNKARAVIMQWSKILLVKDVNTGEFVLPWWTHEVWETIRECFKREIFEELWKDPEIHRCVFVREFTNSSRSSSVDYWFTVKNNEDYFVIHQNDCSHGSEWSEYWFYDIDTLEIDFPIHKNLKIDLQNLERDKTGIQLV